MTEQDATHTPVEPSEASNGCLLTADELKERLKNISKSTLYRMAQQKTIPSLVVGPRLGGRRFIESDVRAALANLVPPPRPPRQTKKKEELAKAGVVT